MKFLKGGSMSTSMSTRVEVSLQLKDIRRGGVGEGEKQRQTQKKEKGKESGEFFSILCK